MSQPVLRRHRGIALALSGGAALGWAHIGALRVLAEENVPIGAVAGSSIGALAGLCLAYGRLDALEEIATSATYSRVFAYLDLHFHRGALLGGRRITRELTFHFGDAMIETLPIPVSIVTSDLDTAEEVRLTHGPAIPAVRASMALPGIFQPVVIDKRVLIDGGVVANLPIAAVRALAPELPVVAVDLMGDYEGHVGDLRGGARSALATIRSAFLMMAVQQTRQTIALDKPDVLVQPAIGHLSPGDFNRASELIALGREAMYAALPQIHAVTKLPQI